ncbi:hypothetical protein HYALB_00002254 [Hymenoscyphus albidus]|uniref:25S rRNA (Uridine(2843)-N(3))-methyltransferase n=1 Tax=Hymenoscyphus albidus TaxID=595503 RepID=A0A9N9LWE9_9HELO|nr:hypothetical protein HYALB_00002254 [Hymenoscyphus albidus]
MGKNGKFGKNYGKVVGKPGDGRPEWKGPAYVKKTAPSKSKAIPTIDEEDEYEPNVPIRIQQLLLDIFRGSLHTVLVSDQLQPILQEIKTALFERQFVRAFAKKEHLEAYAARWSPSRSLCYQSILIDIEEHLTEMASLEADVKPKTASTQCLNAISFGGGAAEVMAFGGYARSLRDAAIAENTSNGEPLSGSSISSVPGINLLLVDSAAWEEVVKKLHAGLTEPPPLSKYASAAAKAANKSLIDAESLNPEFHVTDVLSMSLDQVQELVGDTPKFLSLLFTLNELYTESISKTTAFLLNLTMAAQKGSLLLVVDSPGSYSMTKVGTEEKKYPMKFLLDHTLLETQKVKEDGDDRRRESPPDWVKLESSDARWFRLPAELRYPIPLENMRYQLHLYQRI